MIHGSNTPRSRISVKVFYAFIGNALRKSILLNRTDMVPLNYFEQDAKVKEMHLDKNLLNSLARHVGSDKAFSATAFGI